MDPPTSYTHGIIQTSPDLPWWLQSHPAAEPYAFVPGKRGMRWATSFAAQLAYFPDKHFSKGIDPSWSLAILSAHLQWFTRWTEVRSSEGLYKHWELKTSSVPSIRGYFLRYRIGITRPLKIAFWGQSASYHASACHLLQTINLSTLEVLLRAAGQQMIHCSSEGVDASLASHQTAPATPSPPRIAPAIPS